MPSNVLKRLLPDFHQAVKNLSGDLSILSINVTWLRTELSKDVAKITTTHAALDQKYVEALADMQRAAEDSILRMQALQKVYEAFLTGEEAAEHLRELNDPMEIGPHRKTPGRS